MTRDLAVQLYSLRQMAEKDFNAVLQTVADIGFKAVEPAGFWGMSPEEFLKRINDLGLKLYSSHSPWARPDNLEETIDIAGRLGLDRIVCGYGPEDFKDLDAIKRTAETTSMMQEKLEKAGFMLFQHNHNWEFERIDGRLKRKLPQDTAARIIKPAAGYASCPDHSLKRDILRLLPDSGKLGISLTESCAMSPDASICGLIFVHPDAFYPEIRGIDAKTAEDYARRRNMSASGMELFLGSIIV